MRLFLKSLARYLALFLQAVSSPYREKRRPLGFLLVLGAFPIFVVVQLVHWITLLLDELIFSGYRNVEVREPVFVLGPPRSGTTHLHHVLSADPDTTTFRTWECLFGLSITSRKIILGLAKLDRAIGRPLGRLGAWIGRKFLAPMDDIHPINLDDPEEDFLCLLPIASCFIQVVAFPNDPWIWRAARFDTELNEGERNELLRWYRGCIQRHLYVFGPEKRFLSKNASFSGMPEALLNEFPDARILYTSRDPQAVVPSQLSSLRPALRLFGFADPGDRFRDRLIALLHYYYLHLADTAARNQGRMAMIYNDDLRDNLEDSVLGALQAIQLPASEAFRTHLLAASAASRGFKSGHSYSLGEFGLDADELDSRFADVYRRYDFGRSATDQGTSQ